MIVVCSFYTIKGSNALRSFFNLKPLVQQGGVTISKIHPQGQVLRTYQQLSQLKKDDELGIKPVATRSHYPVYPISHLVKVPFSYDSVVSKSSTISPQSSLGNRRLALVRGDNVGLQKEPEQAIIQPLDDEGFEEVILPKLNVLSTKIDRQPTAVENNRDLEQVPTIQSKSAKDIETGFNFTESTPEALKASDNKELQELNKEREVSKKYDDIPYQGKVLSRVSADRIFLNKLNKIYANRVQNKEEPLLQKITNDPAINKNDETEQSIEKKDNNNSLAQNQQAHRIQLSEPEHVDELNSTLNFEKKVFIRPITESSYLKAINPIINNAIHSLGDADQILTALDRVGAKINDIPDLALKNRLKTDIQTRIEDVYQAGLKGQIQTIQDDATLGFGQQLEQLGELKTAIVNNGDVALESMLSSAMNNIKQNEARAANAAKTEFTGSGVGRLNFNKPTKPSTRPKSNSTPKQINN